MTYDVAFRHQQALDPSALTSLETALHAIDTAITDCRNAGQPIESDPAILLIARHLGAVATDGKPPAIQLRRRCMDAIAEIRRNPVLVTLARRGVDHDPQAKALFHAEGRKALRRLADALGLPNKSYDIRSNQGGPAVSGEIVLHGEQVYVQLSASGWSQDREVMFRRVAGRKDYCGDRNHFASVREILTPDRLATRIAGELGIEAVQPPGRLFA